MKNFTKIILLMTTSLFLLMGCGSKKPEKTIDNFINKLLSVKTYEGITFFEDEDKDEEMSNEIGIEESNESLDKYVEEIKENFGEYFTEDGFDNTMSNLIPHIYYTVINKNNINEITDIKIKKIKESENDTYKNLEFIHYEYEISYKLKSDDKSIDMTDYMIFKVMKSNPSAIEEASIDKEKSSIFNEFINSRN